MWVNYFASFFLGNFGEQSFRHYCTCWEFDVPTNAIRFPKSSIDDDSWNGFCFAKSSPACRNAAAGCSNSRILQSVDGFFKASNVDRPNWSNVSYHGDRRWKRKWRNRWRKFHRYRHWNTCWVDRHSFGIRGSERGRSESKFNPTSTAANARLNKCFTIRFIAVADQPRWTTEATADADGLSIFFSNFFLKNFVWLLMNNF